MRAKLTDAQLVVMTAAARARTVGCRRRQQSTARLLGYQDRGLRIIGVASSGHLQITSGDVALGRITDPALSCCTK
jgi:hypothetical protein